MRRRDTLYAVCLVAFAATKVFFLALPADTAAVLDSWVTIAMGGVLFYEVAQRENGAKS